MPIRSADFLRSVANTSQLPQTRQPCIALFGRSNVGKSSLINDLAQHRHLSRTSRTPGRTQLINIFEINKAFYLIDLPGYGYAKTAKDKKEAFQRLIIDYIEDASSNIALALLIIDARHGFLDLDHAMKESLEKRGIPYLVVANKIDKLNRNEKTQILKTLRTQSPDHQIIPYSTKTSEGRTELLNTIEATIRNIS